MAACSSYLRRPRQAFSLVSSYFKTTTTSRTSITRDPITQPPSLSRFLSSSSSSSIKASSLPWLMLTPEIELSSGTDTVFKFYSLAEGKVISIDRKNLKAQLGLESKRSVSLECRGSSHGWLVLCEGCGGSDLFLYNPLSNRHLKLPTIRPVKSNSQYHCVNKVIISSPDPEGDASCRAMMIHGDKDKLAFCCPKNGGGGGEWVETHHRSDDVACFAAGGGGGVPLFLGVDDSVWPYPEFEGWDLKDVSRPVLISLEDRLAKDFKRTFPWKGFGSKKKPWMSRNANFLVAAAGGGGGGGGGMYYVCLEGGDLDEEWDYRFHVHKFDFEKGKMVHMDRSLDGLALFVGRNHSFALSAAEFPEVLEPDSIYFTHPEDCCLSVDEEPFGKKHMRVYDYKDGTFSKTPFYTVTKSDDEDAVYGPPMWYTPTCAAADELVS